MNVKKAIKKVAAVTTGALLVSSAFAASLSDWPSPFVTEDGQGDVQFVIGDGSTSDYLGAIDIAVALQAAAVSETNVDVDGSAEVSVEGGYDLSGSDEFYLNSTIEDSLDDTELPELLADGSVDYDGGDYDTSQSLDVGAKRIHWEEEDNEPVLKLDLDDATDLWTYTFTMDGAFEAVGTVEDKTKQYEESFTIEMMGKKFTVPADQSDVNNTATGGDELKLFGSDASVVLDLNQPVTVDVDGESYTIEVVSDVKDESNTIVVKVNDKLEQIEKGESKTIGGLDVFAESVFISEVPTLSVSAELFIGSNEIVLGKENVQIDDEDVAGLDANVTFDGDGALESISVFFNPSELRDDVAGFDEIEYLEVGDSVTDPLFGTFSVQFVGGNYELEDEGKAMFEVSTPSDNVLLTAETEEGEVSFEVYNVKNDTELQFVALDSTDDQDGFVGSGQSTVYVDNIFILNEDESERVTKVYEVRRVDIDDGVELYSLGEDKTITVKSGKEIEDTNTYVVNISEDDDNFDLSTNEAGTVADTTEGIIFLKGGYQTVTIGDDGAATADIDFAEVQIASDIDGTFEATATVSVGIDTTDDDASVSVTSPVNFQKAASRDADTDNYLSIAGTYLVADTDNNDVVTGYAVMDEDTSVEYTVVLGGEDVNVVTTGGSSVTTEKVNAFAVGAAVKDVDVNVANPANNLIVIGGTCINSVSAELKEVAAGSCGADSGLMPNEAIIELFDLDNGKVAMLVAGYEAVDTQAASRAVATGAVAAYDKDAVKLTVTSASNYQIE